MPYSEFKSAAQAMQMIEAEESLIQIRNVSAKNMKKQDFKNLVQQLKNVSKLYLKRENITLEDLKLKLMEKFGRG
jgi:arsenate reductase-like glutaredoxin family protein